MTGLLLHGNANVFSIARCHSAAGAANIKPLGKQVEQSTYGLSIPLWIFLKSEPLLLAKMKKIRTISGIGNDASAVFTLNGNDFASTYPYVPLIVVCDKYSSYVLTYTNV